MLIIPLNLDSVLLLLHNSKLAYSGRLRVWAPSTENKNAFDTRPINLDAIPQTSLFLGQ